MTRRRSLLLVPLMMIGAHDGFHAAPASTLGTGSAGWPLEGFILCARSVCVLMIMVLAASAMRLCSPSVSATPSGLYMAIANLGRTLAAALVGWLGSLGAPAAVLVPLPATGGIAIAFLLLAWRDGARHAVPA
jgi:uncharacterized membrane protein